MTSKPKSVLALVLKEAVSLEETALLQLTLTQQNHHEQAPGN